MPLFMDLHIVPGITARGVAQAHVLDLNIQEEFQCSCMTYWIDEANNSAFCLIEAPHENAVRELHKKSHGLIPHHIIEVNKDAVVSFLGRLYDPEMPEVVENLKVFKDPAYRCLVFINIKDPILLRNKIGKEKSRDILNRYFNTLEEFSARWGGETVEHPEQFTSLICFTSASNALSCALKIAEFFTTEENEILELKLSVNDGMPVASGNRIFGDTIDLGKNLLYASNYKHVILSTNLKDTARLHFQKNGEIKISSLTPINEKLLNRVLSILEGHSGNENFGIEEFCREAGLSKSSLNRQVQNIFSRSPNTLLREFRLNKALGQLKKGETISNVAFSTGFRNPSYFSKCFKEHFALSPSDYVDQLRS